MKIKQFLDPVLITGTLISVVVSLALFVLNVGPIPSITLGMLCIIISLLIDLAVRILKQEATFVTYFSNQPNELIFVKSFENWDKYYEFAMDSLKRAEKRVDITNFY